jgi:Flp pilus assembly protein TadD
VDHQSPLYNESSKVSIFYAESWALVHYLALGEDRKFAAHAAAFAAALGNGLPLGDAAQKTLGVSAAELEKGLRRYIGRNVFVSHQIRFSDRMAKVAALAPIPVGEAEVHAMLGDVLLHMGRKNEAQAELGQALALDENLGPAHASLGMLAVQEGQWEASRPHFKRAVASSSANYLCHYYYAVALSQGRGGAQTSVPDEGDIERSFRRAIELNPAFADSYARLAWALARTPEKAPEAAKLMYKALSLAPGREEYILGLGTMLANAEDFTAARQLLEPLAAHAADERLRTEARQRLDGIVDYEKRRAEWDARRTAGGREEPLKTGTGDETPGTTLKLRTLKPGETRVLVTSARSNADRRASCWSRRSATSSHARARDDSRTWNS